MQELGTDVAGILRDLVEFLENLGDIELTDSLESTRDTLLQRMRATLEMSSDSPEPYLDMNAGKSLLTLTTDEVEQPQEYVSADEQKTQRGSFQHYYETFQEFLNDSKGKPDGKTDLEKEVNNVILMYASFSASQAKSKALKSGQLLHLKRERKMFAPINVFWNDKRCWVGLVDAHLLLYANERECRPYLVIPLEGYKSRAAPNAFPRDPRRSEAAFEIYCPGDRTFQFVANNVQDMRDWINALTTSIDPKSCKSKGRAETFVEILELETTERTCIELISEEKEKYQDVLNSPKSKTKEKQPVAKATTPEKEKVEVIKEDAPPLPARTRRLPSLPSQEQIAYEPKEEPYDEEGLYHRIEDVKAQREYQNCRLRSVETTDGPKQVTATDLALENYDDVESINDRSRVKEPIETYDDAHSIAQEKPKDEPISYDDVQNIAENLRGKADKERPVKPSKPGSKRSFLDRVRNRKESIKKDEKKTKSIIITAPPTNPQELPCYDDVSNLTVQEKCENEEENYLSPPPPRPIYSRPPTIIKCAVVGEEIYDDIGSCIMVEGIGCKDCGTVDVIKDYPKNVSSFLPDLQLNIDQEHYQVPRSGNRKVIEHHEELYDDVALSETFKYRQRDSVSSSSPDKSVWSRFGSGKKLKIFDHVNRQTSYNESTDSTDEASKVNPFQKLMNKMENTLGKANKVNGVALN